MNTTEIIYWIGLTVSIGSGIFITGIFLYLIIGQTLNLLGYAFPAMWQTMEYLYYRKEFKEWKALKDAGKVPTEEELETLKRHDEAYEELREIVWSTFDEDGEPIPGTGTDTIGEKVCQHFGT